MSMHQDVGRKLRCRFWFVTKHPQQQNHDYCALQVDEEIASGPSEMESPYPRTGPRSSRARPCTPIARRGSVSNMLDQSTTQVDPSHGMTNDVPAFACM